jgi:hypothetical protein
MKVGQEQTRAEIKADQEKVEGAITEAKKKWSL